ALMQGHMGQVPVEQVMTRTPVFVRVDVPLTEVLDEVRRQVESIGKQVLIKYPVLLDEDDRVLGIVDLSRFILAQTWHWDKIAIVGLGYAGLTLAVSLAEVGFHVVGWEVDPLIRSNLQKGISHVYERGLESLLSAQLADRRFIIPDSGTAIKDCHVYIITVSTPYQDGAANLNLLRQATETTAHYLKPGDLVILRSTVPVGTCRTVVRETIESSTAVKVGR